MSPVSNYNRAFGGKPGSARKAKSSMEEQYGKERGERIFYATVAKKRPGLLKGK